MQTAEIILRYLEVFLKWPVIVFIIIIIFIKVFKNEISDFFRRIFKGEAMGIRFEAMPSEQQKEAKEVLPAKTKSEIEAYIKDNPQLVIIEYMELFNRYFFERTFNIIYGTQIDLLEYLSEKGEGGEKYINLVSFHKEHIRRFGKSSTQMADYLGYLKKSRFIKYEGEENELNVKITPYGIDFLSYIKTYYPFMYKYKPL